MKKGYHKTKSGKMAKKGLWYNIHKKKKAGKKCVRKVQKEHRPQQLLKEAKVNNEKEIISITKT